MQKINSRMDLLTRARYPKNELTRFIIKEGKIVLDEKQVLKSRGFYLHKSSINKKNIQKIESRFKAKFDLETLKRLLEDE